MIRRSIERLRTSTMAHKTMWVFAGQGMRLVLQAVYFILIARVLGVDYFGSFAAAVALVAIVSPFASLGFGNILVKNVSRDRDLFRECWGNTLFMTGASGCLLLVLVMVVAKAVLPPSIPAQLVLIVAISDLIAGRLTDAASQAFQSVEQVRWMAKVQILLSVVRVLAALTLAALFRHPTALQWGYLYGGSSVVPGTIAILLVNHRVGMPRPNLRIIWRQMREGFYFSTGLSAQTVYNDLDKAMLAKYSTLDATGLYAAAYRIIDVLHTPIRSLLYAAASDCFRAGSSGIRGSVAFMRRLMPKALAYSLLILCVLLVSAPIIPHILGKEYAHSVEAVRWLAFLPLLRTVHSFYSDALTGAGFQGLRMSLQVVVAVFNVLINLWLIPAYSWRGAVYSSLASDALLAVVIVSAAMVLCRMESARSLHAPMRESA